MYEGSLSCDAITKSSSNKDIFLTNSLESSYLISDSVELDSEIEDFIDL